MYDFDQKKTKFSCPKCNGNVVISRGYQKYCGVCEYYISLDVCTQMMSYINIKFFT